MSWADFLRFLCGAAWILVLGVGPAIGAWLNRDGKSRSI